MRFVSFCVSSLAAILFIMASAQAAPITLIRSGNADFGVIDGVSFFDADFTITSLGDTDDVISGGSGVQVLAHDSSSIVIDGVGSFDFVTPTLTFVLNDGFTFGTGFGRPGLDLYTGPFGTPGSWDLASSLDLISGPGFIQQWSVSSMVTSGGVLFLNSGTTPTTFEAIVTTVPAPGALALIGFGLIGIAARRRTA